MEKTKVSVEYMLNKGGCATVDCSFCPWGNRSSGQNFILCYRENVNIEMETRNRLNIWKQMK